MGDLKPCPFCGETELSTCRDEFGERVTFCDNCGVCGPPSEDDTEQILEAWNTRATTPEVKALVEASTALRDQIARWHEGGPAAGPDESRALFEALDDAIAKWEAAQC